MNVTRRRFLKLSVGTIGAAATAEAAAFGVDVSAAEQRALAVPIKTGRQVPSVCPYCSVGCGQIVTGRRGRPDHRHPGQPRLPDQRGHPLPQRRRDVPTGEQRTALDQGQVPRPGQRPLGGQAPRLGDGPHRGPDQADPRRELQRVPGDPRRQGRHGEEARDEHLRPRLARRRDDGQRVELRPSEADARAGGRLPSRTRPGYDTPPRSPVWGSASVAAVPRHSRATSSTRTRS